MIILMIYTCLTTYLGDGPMWPKQIESAQNCRESWWTNLLYVNNLVLVNKQVRMNEMPKEDNVNNIYIIMIMIMHIPFDMCCVVHLVYGLVVVPCKWHAVLRRLHCASLFPHRVSVSVKPLVCDKALCLHQCFVSVAIIRLNISALSCNFLKSVILN